METKQSSLNSFLTFDFGEFHSALEYEAWVYLQELKADAIAD